MSEHTSGAGSCSVSVVIPAYNRIEPLKYTLRSAGRALAAWGEPGEIVVDDDGSVPLIEEQLDGFETHGSVRYLRQPNAGSIVARNHGLGESRGEYVLFLDSDDLIHPEKFLRQVPLMREWAADISYCDMADVSLGPDYGAAQFVVGAKLDAVSTAAELLLSIQPPPHSPLYRRDYLVRHLASPLIPQQRGFDPVGDIWIYYNLAPFPAVVVKVDAAMSAVGPHEEDRYSRQWESLGVAALLLVEAFFNACPADDSTRHSRLLAGEAAFHSWRRLPRGFSRDFARRQLALWRNAPKGPVDRLGGKGFQWMAALMGPELAARLLRLRNQHYDACRTMDDEAIAALLARANAMR